MPGAVSLYTLAASLLPADDVQRLAFLPELGTALVEVGRMEAADEAFAEAIRACAKQHEYTERAMELAIRAGDSKGTRENIQMLCGLLQAGPTPVDVALARSD